jgi:hypothetical protein
MNNPQIGEVGQYGQPDVGSGARPQAALVLNVLAVPDQWTLVDIVVFEPPPVASLSYLRVPVATALTPGAWSALPYPELEGVVSELRPAVALPPQVINLHLNLAPAESAASPAVWESYASALLRAVRQTTGEEFAL